MNPTAINLQALQDPTHPDHHDTLGRVFGFILLGLSIYQTVRTPGGTAALLQPTNAAQLLNGALSILHSTSAQ